MVAKDHSIETRLKIIEQKIDLGSFDSLFVGINVFLAGVIIAIGTNNTLISGLTAYTRLTWAFLLMFAFFLVVLFVAYLSAINDEKVQLSQRLVTIKLYYAIGAFIFFDVVFATILYFSDKFLTTTFGSGAVTLTVEIIDIVAGVTIFWLLLKGPLGKKVDDNFHQRYPLLYSKK